MLRIIGQSTGRKRAAQKERTLESFRGSHSSIQLDIGQYILYLLGNCSKPGKDHLKGMEKTMPGAQTGLEIMLGFTKQTGEPRDLWGIG